MQEHTIQTARTARYLTLGGERAPVEEMWMVLHGYGQLARFFLRPFEHVAAPGRLIVAPEALGRFYLDAAHRRVGASWMTREHRLGEIADYVAYLDAVFAEACARVGAEPQTTRLVALGFSQGTATVCRWLDQSPLLRARTPRAERLVLWGGEVPHDLDLQAAQPWLAQTRLSLVAGEQDAIATPERIEALETRLREAGVPARTIRFAGDHRMDGVTLRTLAAADD